MLTNQVSMMPINTCRESQKPLHGPHASINSIVAFHYLSSGNAIEKQEKTAIFIESGILSEEDE